LVHRDVKPANVLVSTDGRVHLADFGIARLVDSAHETRTGDVLGTPAYFAPEQVAGEPVGPPADVYALGVVLFECLTGARPYEGTAVEVAMARLVRSPEIPPDLPADWRALLTAMTLRDPASRPSSGQVAMWLRRIATGTELEETAAMVGLAAPATTVLPRAPEATQAIPAYATTVLPGAAPPAPAPALVAGRRGPRPVVVVVIILLVVAVAAGVIVAVRSQNSGSGAGVKYGTPRLHQPLERDVRRLENLVHK
jgi:hypothetical protein